MHIWTYELQTLVMKICILNLKMETIMTRIPIIDGKTGGHIPKNLSKTFKRFLTFPNCTIKCTVIEKCVNRGAGYGLEIPVKFKFLGQAKAIQWAGNAVKKVI